MEPQFALIGIYQYSSEAIIFKGKLESEGITVYMHDNITIDTDPLISNAIGGVKLFVRQEEVEKAQGILSQVSNYSVDNDHQLICCPKCGQNKVLYLTSITSLKSLMSFLFGFILNIFPFYIQYKYRCEACKFEFL
jgi:hypothetical protein